MRKYKFIGNTDVNIDNDFCLFCLNQHIINNNHNKYYYAKPLIDIYTSHPYQYID